MKRDRLYCRRLALVVLLILSSGPGAWSQGQRPLSADAVMQKAVERAEWAAAQKDRPNYTYQKATLTEELDADGNVKERKEKHYEAVVDSGLTYLKLLKVNGRDLSPSELKKQEERELKDRGKLTQKRTSNGGDNRENFLTDELVAKYDFTILDRRPIKGRPAFVLTFQPKAGLAAKQVTDRLLNQLAGKIWIDEQEFEIARIEIHLRSEVKLWGGILASLKRFTFTLGRTRLREGDWFNTMSRGDFEGRKLLDSVRIRTQSESTNFRKLERERF